MSKQEMPAFYHLGVEVPELGDVLTRPVFTIDLPAESLDRIPKSAQTQALIGHIGTKLQLEEPFVAEGNAWGFGAAGRIAESAHSYDGDNQWVQVRFGVPQRPSGYLKVMTAREQHMPLLGSMQVVLETLNHGIRRRTGLRSSSSLPQYMTASLDLQSGVGKELTIKGAMSPPVVRWLHALDENERSDESNSTAATIAHMFDAASPWPSIDGTNAGNVDMIDMLGFDANLQPGRLELGVRTGRAALGMNTEGSLHSERVTSTDQLLGLLGGITYLAQRAAHGESARVQVAA